MTPILPPRPPVATVQTIAVGTRVLSYHPKFYNYPGVVVKLAPLTVRITGQDVEINRVDLEVVS